jgi:hypothetical protein
VQVVAAAEPVQQPAVLVAVLAAVPVAAPPKVFPLALSRRPAERSKGSD